MLCATPWLTATSARAQVATPATPGAAFFESFHPREAFSSPDSQRGPSPAVTFLSSLVLPGAGQYRLHQPRWIAYVGADLAGWVVFLGQRGDGKDLRDDYRDLAWEQARRGGASGRVDPGFEYFETLSKWIRSGSYDRDPDLEGVQPETDPTTFNGSIWALATGIFFPDPTAPPPESDPRYQRALRYYRDRAYTEDLEWDWSEAPDAQSRFRDLIKRSDAAFRHATLAAGALLLNHVLSATDGFVSARLREATAGHLSGRIRLTPGRSRGILRFGIVFEHGRQPRPPRGGARP